MKEDDMRTVSVAEAARRLGRSRHTVKKLMDQSLVTYVIWTDGTRRIEERELERFYRSLPRRGRPTE